jgi:N-acetylmuramoyl-L-alanine amidase
MRKILYLVIHSTATPVTATIESMKRYWKDVMKWKNPGYHYIIKRDGEIVTITAEENIANGVAGNNAHAIHISYIGGIEEKGKLLDNRTDEQKVSMYKLLLELAKKYPDSIIRGHRDFSPDKNKNGVLDEFEWIKGCPSFDVTQWLENYHPVKQAA